MLNSDNFLQISKRRAKIVVTIGPSSNSRETISSLIAAGMNVVRLNFSHGTHEQHEEVLNIVREEAKNQSKYIAVFQDLCGPKVRISEVEEGTIHLTEGEEIKLAHFKKGVSPLGNKDKIFIEAFDPFEVFKIGDKALLADGKIELKALEKKANEVICTVLAGGQLRSRSGIATPDSKLSIPCLTEKDLHDVTWAVKNKVDYIALSFVENAKDILELKAKVTELGAEIPIIAKIERASSLDKIEEIIEATDAVMVARGDLGLELPLEKVPSAQKLIIETSNAAGKPVITATQMLMSMVHEVRPTRAEVSDVYTAVRDGTDAVMLSDETAIGKYPIKAVQVLDRIVVEAESQLQLENIKTKSAKISDGKKVVDAVCYAAYSAAEKVSATAVIACTQSGHTAKLIAKYRPQQPIFAATSGLDILNRMALYWGVNPIYVFVGEEKVTEDEVNLAMAAVRDLYGLKPGSRVVITAGLRAKKIGTTTLMEIREIPRGF